MTLWEIAYIKMLSTCIKANAQMHAYELIKTYTKKKSC
jgi:hypothetical protein